MPQIKIPITNMLKIKACFLFLLILHLLYLGKYKSKSARSKPRPEKRSSKPRRKLLKYFHISTRKSIPKGSIRFYQKVKRHTHTMLTKKWEKYSVCVASLVYHTFFRFVKRKTENIIKSIKFSKYQSKRTA